MAGTATGFNIASPLIGKSQQSGQNHSAYKQMMEQDLGKNIDFLFQVMVKKAQSMMPGKENDTDLSQTVLQVASTIQQARTGESMDELNRINRGAYSLAVMNMQGHVAEHKSDQLLFDGAPQEISTVLPKGIKSAEMLIFDNSMQIVRSFKIDPNAGRKTIQWDGLNRLGQKASEGNYTVKVKAVNQKDKELAVDTYVGALITGTEFNEHGHPQLLSNTTKINEIYNIRKPQKPITAAPGTASTAVDYAI